MIRELCAARAEDRLAIEEADRLVSDLGHPYDEARLQAFCLAGDRMMAAHDRKMAAWNNIRTASTRLAGNRQVNVVEVKQPAV